MASAALPETLQSITATKIVELKKQRGVFETAQSQIVTQARQSRDVISQTQALLTGVCGLEGVRVTNDSSSDDEADFSKSEKAAKLRNQQMFLRQARIDPAFPGQLVKAVHADLRHELELKRVRHEHAQFFSDLVTEWISSNPDEQKAVDTSSNDVSEMDTSTFESVGRREMHEQRAQWEELVFRKSEVDTLAIDAYLEKLFKSSKPVTIAYDNLRKSCVSYCSSLRYGGDLFDTDSLKVAIQGLIATDLLTEERRDILKTFSTNKEVLKEVADVLNMRFAALDTWDWSTMDGAINVEQRRQLNGKYRVFMDEDVLDALLIHAIGMKWAVFFKSALTRFFDSYAWQRNAPSVPTLDRERREWFLGKDEESSNINVQQKRRDAYARDYFMTQLPVDEAEGARGYGDSDDENDLPSSRKSPLEVKHSLLHLVITEALLARHLRPNERHAIIRSDFRWHGPSLSHSTIFTVLKFFGIDAFWLEFFRKFLQAPLRFVQDGRQGQIQIRQRGVPMSHALSDVFSELILFVMDFAVNNSTKTNLIRMHDDFWLWSDLNTCRRGWHQMTVFASVMGIEFNEEKTGSVVFEPKSNESDDGSIDNSMSTTPDGLPVGEIRWGFLRLDQASVRFQIDQSMVDEHIKELQLQLSYSPSIFSYVQAYNAYFARFFSNNFGKPSYAFGREHVDMMINTFIRIQNALFPDGSVIDHLEEIAKERFKIADIPQGFWYWPVKMGGTELRNALVPLFGMRESLHRSPERMLEKALELDENEYLSAKERYEKLNTGSGLGKYNHELKRKLQASDGEFMSKEEYLKYREERSLNLANVYEKLLSIPPERSIETTPEISSLLKFSENRSRKLPIHQNFNAMEPYWKWIVAVHGTEIVEKYGSVQIVDAGQVPLGVVSVLKAGKIRWKG